MVCAHHTTYVCIDILHEYYVLYVGLIKKLWEPSFTAAQLKSGFRASGLHPINRQAISASKLAPSVPYVGSHPASATTSPESEVAVANTTRVSLSISVVQSTSTCASGVEQASTLPPSVFALGKEVTCQQCGGAITPVELHVVATLPNTCKGKTCKTKDKRKVKPTYYALTRDEMLERIEEAERTESQEKWAKKEGTIGSRRHN